MATLNAEQGRLAEDARREKNWKRWGPYLAERQWATVREDYSADGDSWKYFTHEDARSRAYRWGEDGLLGITDRECRLCFALALWNGRDPILKERLFGLTNAEGNHGEDVKECYFYTDATPTHSWLKALYKYPQAEFPYERLRAENRARNRDQPEYELLDTGIFEGERYFDVQVEYAKAGPNDLCIQIAVANRGPEAAKLHVLPTLWFRNTWSWGCRHEGCEVKPRLRATGAGHGGSATMQPWAGTSCDVEPAKEGDARRSSSRRKWRRTPRVLFGGANAVSPVKDVRERVRRRRGARNNGQSRPASARSARRTMSWTLAPGEERCAGRLRLYTQPDEKPAATFGEEFRRDVWRRRRREADAFYAALEGGARGASRPGRGRSTAPAAVAVARQAYAGLLWTKQFYHYIVPEWISGDPDLPPPPAGRGAIRNGDWPHFFARDVLSMPDCWEYPWFAAWDLAFHMIPFAKVDPDFAKGQLNLLLREWYMNPNGQIPAYEWNFSDVNPPVHAWACWRVYKMTGPRGGRDRLFLARVFQKLLMNFTWWVNRKDPNGRHLFSGGFLGLDNIGVFDRSKPLPTGGTLEQADGTAWMAFYCGTMLSMALELAEGDPSYEDIASKFFEHFVSIADAMNTFGGTGPPERGRRLLLRPAVGRWPRRRSLLRMRTLVGVIPLFFAGGIHRGGKAGPPAGLRQTDAVVPQEPARAGVPHLLPGPRRAGRRPAAPGDSDAANGWSACSRQRLRRKGVPPRPCGIRSMSRAHADHPFHGRAGRPGAPGGLRAGRIRGRGSSAATPTGGGRCGFRSTTS